MRHVKALVCFGLPTVVRSHRTDSCDPIALLALHEQIRIDVAAIHELLIGHKVMVREVFLNDLGQFHILHIGHGRLHIRNQLGENRFLSLLGRRQGTRFGEMDFVPQPDGLPLFAGSCFRVIGRTNDPFFGVPPARS